MCLPQIGSRTRVATSALQHHHPRGYSITTCNAVARKGQTNFNILVSNGIVALREVAVVIGAILGILVLKERLDFWKALAIAAITAGIFFIKAG